MVGSQTSLSPWPGDAGGGGLWLRKERFDQVFQYRDNFRAAPDGATEAAGASLRETRVTGRTRNSSVSGANGDARPTRTTLVGGVFPLFRGF